MPLASGQTLSFYEILGSLGVGAMGEVYRAKDTRLDREVAIKVLPEHFAEDEHRLRRFEREAKTLASLNHPNVAQVFGIDQVGDISFIAMELVPGEDLAARLARDPLSVDEAIDVCLQVALGLEAAHDAGVVHRDLKPANVRVTPDGAAKVLDFGLAKASRSIPSASGESGSFSTTAEGTVLGTPAYMSPEQARGKPVDHRTDVWAFGCVLYECLTGLHAFRGNSITDVLAAIVASEPDWGVLPAGTPPAVRRLLQRCLSRDVRARLQHVGEARIVLEHPVEDGSATQAAPVVSIVRRLFVAIVVVALVVVAYALGSRSDQALLAGTMRLAIQLPVGLSMDLPNPRSAGRDGVAPPLALSPDGKLLVYVAREGDGPIRLYLRALDSFETRVLEGTENAESPFFSPDGQWVGFFTDGGIFRVAVNRGGAPISVCPIATFDRPSAGWGRDGRIVFSRGINAEGRLEYVPAEGGAPRQLTVPDFTAGESWHGLPRLLPDGETILFTATSREKGARAALLDLDSGDVRIVAGTGEAAGARFLRGPAGGRGFLVFAQLGRILAVAFDPESGRLTGVPWPVVEQVSSSALGIGHWDCTEDGTLVYVSGNVAETELVLVDRAGKVQWRAPEVGVYQHPRLSADGKHLLVDWMRSGARDIWMYDLAHGVPTRLTSEFQNMDPLWAPDGRHIVFSRFVQGVRTLHLLDTGAVGAKPTALLDAANSNQVAGTWSPTGELLFTIFGDQEEDLWLLTSLENPEARPVLEGSGLEGWGALSPDGRYLAYVSKESGELQVYVCSYPELSSKQRVSRGRGSEPLWSSDGKELFYRRDSGFLAVPITDTEAGLELGTAESLFEGTYDSSPTGHQHYDVSRDGKTFALAKMLESETPSEVRVLLNWRPWEDTPAAGR